MSKPEFEVVSIRPSVRSPGGYVVSCTGGPGTGDPSLFRCSHYSLANLLARAFQMDNGQISGPPWMNFEMFDVQARVPRGATRRDLRAMLRDMLIERFALVEHRETRDVKEFKLVIAKGGPKLSASSAARPGDSRATSGAAESGLPRIGPGHEGIAMGRGHAVFYRSNMTLDELAVLLTAELHTPVMNSTGLMGNYNVGLRWSPHAEAAGALSGGPSLPDALKQQLGLGLQWTKGPREFLIIDHINHQPVVN
ncbi:MAG: TIGR03435 family protein [Terriglobales bacterium]